MEPTTPDAFESPNDVAVALPATARVALTVVIPTLDEAHQIADAVDALTWADEVIVVDGGSTDLTACIAEAHGARVLELRDATIGAQRNAGIAAATNEWVLALDADERVSAELVEELLAVTRAPAYDAYRLRFRNFYGDRELRHGKWANDAHVRLFRRRYRFTTHHVHERLEDVPSVGELSGRILHTPYRDLEHHVRKIVKYARLGAEDLSTRGDHARVWQLVVRPSWRFVRDYVGYGAYRDGRFGLIMSALSAWAAFLKYAFLFMLDGGS